MRLPPTSALPPALWSCGRVGVYARVGRVPVCACARVCARMRVGVCAFVHVGVWACGRAGVRACGRAGIAYLAVSLPRRDFVTPPTAMPTPPHPPNTASPAFLVISSICLRRLIRAPCRWPPRLPRAFGRVLVI